MAAQRCRPRELGIRSRTGRLVKGSFLLFRILSECPHLIERPPCLATPCRRAVSGRRRNTAQKQRLTLSRHLSLNPAKVRGAQSTLIISRLRCMLNSALNVGRLLATYRSWAPARDLSELGACSRFIGVRRFPLCSRTLNILNETSAMGRDFSDHRTDASEQR